MDDPELALKDFLYSKWNLADALAKAKIKFHRAHHRYEGSLKKPQIIFGHTAGNQTLTENELLEGIVGVTVDVVMWATKNSTAAVESAKVSKWAIMEEIERILQRETPIPTDWEIAFVSDWFNLDDFAASQPLLKERLIVTVHFQRVIPP